jgi:hypothetical protein
MHAILIGLTHGELQNRRVVKPPIGATDEHLLRDEMARRRSCPQVTTPDW